MIFPSTRDGKIPSSKERYGPRRQCRAGTAQSPRAVLPSDSRYPLPPAHCRPFPEPWTARPPHPRPANIPGTHRQGEIFRHRPHAEKYNWFQNIISMFYEKYKFKNIAMQELSSINKEVLQYMVQEASFYLQPKEPQRENEEILESKKINKQDAYMNDFNQRQQVYEQMNKMEVPDTIDFSEKDDTPSNSMEEMLQKQKQARDLDLQPFPTEQIRPPVKLENEIVTIKNDVEDISTLYENNTINYEKFCMQQEEMQEYKNTIKDLQKEVEEIKKLLKQEST